MTGSTPRALITVAGVILCWMFFVGVFLLRKRTPKLIEAKRDKSAAFGIFLQMVGFFLVFFQPPRRPFLPPVAALHGAIGVAFSVVTVSIAAGSAWLVRSAARALGKQWAVRARLLEDHRLITDGPYSYVRNPIYTGMLGLLIATGLAFERWIALPFAIVIFMVGLVIRVKTEERLLRSAFGADFDQYTKKVPAVIPGIY